MEENMTKMVEEIDKSYLRKMQVHLVRRIVISGYIVGHALPTLFNYKIL